MSDVADASPGPEVRPRKSRAPIYVGLCLLVIGLAVGGWFLFRGGGGASKSLVHALPKGLPMVFALNFKPVFEHPWIAAQLDRPETQKAFKDAKDQAGIDVLELDCLVAGFRVQGEIQFLMIVRGAFDVARFNALVAKGLGGSEIDVDGLKLHRLALGQALEEYFPPMLRSDPHPVVERPPLPRVADIAIGAVDDRTLVAGTPALIAAWKAGGESVADDPALAPFLAEVDTQALAWGVLNLAARSPEALLFRALNDHVKRPAGMAEPPPPADVAGSFDMNLDSEGLSGEALYEYATEAEARIGETALAKVFDGLKGQLPGLINPKITVRGDGKRVVMEFAVPIPFPKGG